MLSPPSVSVTRPNVSVRQDKKRPAFLRNQVLQCGQPTAVISLAGVGATRRLRLLDLRGQRGRPFFPGNTPRASSATSMAKACASQGSRNVGPS
jgi:hypothetical protein